MPETGPADARAASPPRGSSPSGRRSPEQPKLQLDTENPLYSQAMSKLTVAAFKFNKERNGIWLGTIENRELDAELFRSSLRSAMDLKLSKEEFATLMPHWDNDGYVNGCDFILLFYRIRFEYRSKLLTTRIAKEKAYRQKDADYMEARRKEIEGKTITRVSYNFTQQEKDSALEKVRLAAFKFDKQGNGAPNLDAFDCEFLTPEAFKEVLRRTFNLNFSPPELGAFVEMVSDDPAEHRVRCASFLIYFLRLGMDERNARLKMQWAEKKRINDAALKLEQERLAEAEAKNKSRVATFTEEHKIRALSKLRQAAKNYDPVSGMSMKSFEVSTMAPHEFKEQLKRVFNLKLSAPEMGAVISIFDASSTGTVPCSDFAKTFLAMGFAERAARDKNNIVRQREAEAQRLADIEQQLQEQANKNNKINIPVGEVPKEADLANMQMKLRESAMWFEKGAPGSPNLEAFEAKTMPVALFKEQLRTSFKLTLSPIELIALLQEYQLLTNVPGQEEGSIGEVVSDLFMQLFLRLGFEERYAKERRWRELQRANDAKALKHAADKQAALDAKMLLSVASYTKGDFDSAMYKVTQAAIHYHKSPTDVLDAFEAESLPPHVFKEQLKLAFNVKVNMPELGALVSYYDYENKGSVRSKYFLNAFLRLGYEERDKIRNNWREEDKRKAAKDADFEAAKEELKAQKHMAEVEFEFLEEDFDHALMKFIKLCFNFETRQLGPAGWMAFTCKSFTPPEFREIVKRTFDVKLNAKELGALVTYFQIKDAKDNASKTVNCQFFLQCFVQGRTSTEAFKGKPNEQALLREYHVKLKEEYKLRKERTGMNIDERRPWRSNVSMKKNSKGIMAMIAQRPYPPDPASKILRRIAAGKDSGRMDLSTRAVQPESDGDAGMVQLESPDAKKKSKNKKGNAKDSAVATANANDGNNLAAKSARAQAQAYADAQTALSAEDNAKRAEFRLLSVPDEIFSMVHLTELWLCGNLLGFLPQELGALKELTILSLSHNDLNTLPIEVCGLTKLTKLLLRRNNLSELPDIFENLTQLVEVDLSRNNFREFPQVLCSCTALTSLRIGYNNITTVPKSLVMLKSLSFLSLESNPIVSPPPVFAGMPWLDVAGAILPNSERSAYRFKVTKEDEVELEALLKSKGLGRKKRDQRLNKAAPGRIMGY